MAQIIVKNGLEKDLSNAMSKGTIGEPIFTTDTEKFFVTNGSKVVEIGATDPDVMEHIKTLQDTKVDKVSGKGLSTNDYTTAEKNKLAGITAGANNYVHPTDHPASMIKFTDGKTFQQKLDDGSLRGPQGASGPQGPAGTAGAKGNTGTSMRFKGAWSSATAYVCDANYVDIVTSGGNTYRCKANHTNQPVSNTTYWELLAQKGDTGPQGIQGSQGPAGPNTLTTSTTTSGFTDGHYLYNNNGKVAAKALPVASTSAAGVVQLSSATDSTSTTLAATASAVKAAYDLGVILSEHRGYITSGRITDMDEARYNGKFILTFNGDGSAEHLPNTGSGEQTYMVDVSSENNTVLVQYITGIFGMCTGRHFYRTLTFDRWSEWYELYHSGKKPTPAEIGAISNDGSIHMQGALHAKIGSMSAYNANNCGYVFSGDGDSGMFCPSDGNLSLAINGHSKIDLDGNYITNRGCVNIYVADPQPGMVPTNNWATKIINPHDSAYQNGLFVGSRWGGHQIDVLRVSTLWNDSAVKEVPALQVRGDGSTLIRTLNIGVDGNSINVANEINNLKSSVSSGKNAIASAITAKGVAASGSDSHATLANKIGQINSINVIRSSSQTSSMTLGGTLSGHVEGLPPINTIYKFCKMTIQLNTSGTVEVVVNGVDNSTVIYRQTVDAGNHSLVYCFNSQNRPYDGYSSGGFVLRNRHGSDINVSYSFHYSYVDLGSVL